MHRKRFYRCYTEREGVSFNVKLHSTDLFIKADKNLYGESYRILSFTRNELEEYIEKHDEFLHSLDPLAPHGDEPGIVLSMINASAAAGTGPMAAVAGAVAEKVGFGLLNYTEEVIVENGGDIWMKLIRPSLIGIYADNIYFRNNVGIKIYPEDTPCSVCTSTSKLGHSISFGKADSVTVVAANGALADAMATAVCNMVKTGKDIERALEFGMSINGVRGVVVIFRDLLGVQGRVELAPV
jgi:ApbE superfamily uncharacterized protein (UPF0280 family)